MSSQPPATKFVRFPAFIGTGVVLGIVLGVVIAIVGPDQQRVGAGSAMSYLATVGALLGALAGAVAGVAADSWLRRRDPADRPQ